MDRTAREAEWAFLLKLSMTGDARAYNGFLTGVTPHLRSIARRRCAEWGAAPGDAEDIVQEVLLAIHLKRGTWDPDRPLGPWLSAIVRNKLIDCLRRKGRRIDVVLDDVMETLAAEEDTDRTDRLDAVHLVDQLGDPQRTIVRSISLNGESIRETADRLQMTEGAVRVALHRALKTLAALYRRSE